MQPAGLRRRQGRHGSVQVGGGRMPISRRAFSRLFAVAGLIAAPMAAKAAADPGLPKVVYHLSDIEKVGFVLVNIDNHIKGMGGPAKGVIALVVHGPPLAM